MLTPGYVAENNEEFHRIVTKYAALAEKQISYS
jgi:hypothetical protein